MLVINLFSWLGGGEYSVLNLLKNLRPDHVRAVAMFNMGGPLVDELERAGIETVIFPYVVAQPRTLLLPANIVRNIRAAFALKRLAREREIDVIQCSDVFTLLLLIPTLAALRTPVVYSIIVFYSRLRCWLFNLLALAFVSRIVANSLRVREDLLNKTAGLGTMTSVAYNGVDPLLFYPRSAADRVSIRERLSLPVDKCLIGLIGRFEVWKGHRSFVDAARILSQQRPDLRFVFIGGAITERVAPHVARYRDSVIAQIGGAGLADQVIMLGHRDDVPELMAALDVCVCPSDEEPYGMVVPEAVASGIPVVASRTVGALEVVRDLPGVFIAEPRNPESLAGKIAEAIDFSRGTGAAPHSAVDQLPAGRFRWQEYAGEFEKLYDLALAGR